MYHALFEGADLSRIDAEDRPYAVGRDAFARQLDAVAERLARGGPEPDDGAPAVALSFDDGHASNVDVALPMLLERDLDALFFVTSGFVGARPHFVDAPMLRELAAAGMSVGGHGRTHRFFDDLGAEEALGELRDAREALESIRRGAGNARCRSPAVATTPARGGSPGRGRRREALFDSRCAPADPVALARALTVSAHPGGSGTGVDKDVAGARRRRTIRPEAAPVPRVAVRRDTDRRHLRAHDRPRSGVVRRRAARRTRAGDLARRVLGNRIYHGLYKSLRAG